MFNYAYDLCNNFETSVLFLKKIFFLKSSLYENVRQNNIFEKYMIIFSV